MTHFLQWGRHLTTSFHNRQKQCHQLKSKHSNHEPMENISYSNHNSGLSIKRNIIQSWKGKKHWHMLHSIDGPWKHCNKWNKPGIEGQILYDYFFMTWPE
jgi:hypothetical protein